MSAYEDLLTRPRFEPGGDNAYVHFTVFGAFPQKIALPLQGRTPLEPDFRARAEVRRLNRREHPGSFPDAVFLRSSRADDATVAAVHAASEAVVIRATLPDPPALTYLRDAANLASAALDAGGVAVSHLQTIGIYSKADWERLFGEAAKPPPTRHVQIFTSPERDGTQWFHTRGLRAFGRPDLSLHGVPPKLFAAAEELFRRFIHWQVDGGRIQEGQAIRLHGLPDDMRCRHGGDFDDPDFNNKHVEIAWGKPAMT